MIVSPITLAQQTSMQELIESIQKLNKNITFENANNRGTIEGCIEASIKLNNRKFYLLWTNFSDEIFHNKYEIELIKVVDSDNDLRNGEEFKITFGDIGKPNELT